MFFIIYKTKKHFQEKKKMSRILVRLIFYINYSMGGRLVTIGSDAHIAENASIGFEKAIKILKEIGFENICYFKYRKVNKIHI